MASLTDTFKPKNDTDVAKAVIDAFKENVGINKPSPSPAPMPTPRMTPPPTPSPAKIPPPSPLSTARSILGSSSNNVAGSKNGGKPPGMPIGAIVGIVVGAIAVVLMVAAFTIWYRRFKRASASSFSKNTPRRRKASSHAGTTADFSTIDTTRMLQNRTDLLATATGGGGGAWDDPAIVAARIPLEKVETHALLSRGGFGEVYRGTYKGQVVAIKKLLPATRKDLKHIESFFAEVKLMATLEHERIVTFLGVAWDSLSDVCVLSEFMDGGDLRTLLMRFEVQEQRAHGLDADKLRIALHVVHALTYLHSLQPIVLHRDLKSKNILLDTHLHAKLTDFGVSREQSDATMTAGVGTSLWMAPEVMLGDRYDEKSDIFSFGVVLSELDSHLLPYAHAKHADSGNKLTDTAILQLVSMGRLRVAFSDSVAPELCALGEACVAVDPSERPTAAEVLYKLQLALKAAERQ